MNLKSIIKNRRTAQQFLSDPISGELLTEAIELMAYAPNHKHSFPWGAYRLSAEERTSVSKMLAEKKINKLSKPSPAQIQAVRSNLSSIPEILVLLQKKQEDPKLSKEDYASIACGVQNLSLYLWQNDIACKWSTSSVTSAPEFKSLLKIDWSAWSCEGLLFIGKPARIPKRPERPKVLINF